MDAVHKYRVPVGDISKVSMPVGAQILHFGTQGAHGVTLWALVDTEADNETRVFFVRGTGHDCKGLSGAAYLATVFKGPFVFHIFDGGTSTEGSEDFDPIQLIADSLGPGLSCGCDKSYRCLRDGCISCCYCGTGTRLDGDEAAGADEGAP